MTNEEVAIRQHLSKDRPNAAACGCLGPQDNEPLCPCAMNWVEQVDDKWYQIKEHRSVEGVTHTAELIGNVSDNYRSCPDDKLQCRNIELVRTRAYWLEYECKKCGFKTASTRKK